MKFRLAEIEVSDDDPFKHDSLQREDVVEFVGNLIKQLEGPFVLALDSPWGTGKTTVVNMLRAVLKKDEYTTVYFNAWKEDYVSDPLIPMVAVIDDIKIEQAGVFQQRMAKVKKVVSTVAKRGLVAGVKVGTMGVLDLDKVQEDVLSNESGKAAEDLIESFKKEKRSLETFRETLEDAVQAIGEGELQRPLVFFIDELDRCRPSFAIELLERVKHLFDVKNIVFVLSVDKKQLEAITAAVYGERIDALEYLRRFIDLDFSLPLPHTKAYTRELIKRFDLKDFFEARRKHSSLAYDHDHFVEAFTLLAATFDLSLRVRERCLTRLAVVLMQTPDDHYLDPIVLSLLIVLRLKRLDLYEGLISGVTAPQDFMETLRSIPTSRKFFESRFAKSLEAYLIIGDVISERSQQLLKQAEEFSKLSPDTEKGRRARTLLEMSRTVGGDWGRDFSLKHVANKVDLSARIGDLL
ncbi:MAG: hypothetical protein HEQ17_08615 [Limnohabitans sp.]|jgi:hypothetical protein|uniref:KAP family P-loop NTPase fold protein n=1 Tax=Limnohabitans sp. TaxID=1907725 RepID=UPI0025E0A452|nr:P-loop NTPase fold protein [Limnohabitans sp.]MCO4088993.1 hypothetical protein [Limnohabitans sp.]